VEVNRERYPRETEGIKKEDYIQGSDEDTRRGMTATAASLTNIITSWQNPELLTTF
jgi:hypothetical protein